MNPGNELGRPRQESGLITSTALNDTVLDGLDAIHHAWLAGYDLGLVHGQGMAVHQLAHELLHRQAAEMAAVAVQTARQRHGENWADLVRDQAVG